MKLFQQSQHQPFLWPGDTSAVLLVHGFPGTPAEMRPLGTRLHQENWTVQGLLLPGFGAEFATLFERHHNEWLTAIQTALEDLQRDHDHVLLVGYSLGAALSLQVATRCVPTGLILLAPFWYLMSSWQQLLGFLLRPFVHQVRPFRKTDFSDPQVRRGLANFFPETDLNDAELQQTLRELIVPVRVFEQIHRVGQLAYQQAAQITVPTLIVQGILDEVVQRHHTQRMLQRFPGPIQYVEVETGHDLLATGQANWSQFERAILTFATQIKETH